MQNDHKGTSQITLHHISKQMRWIEIDLFTHWIYKGYSKGFVSKVEQLFFQYGLLNVQFCHLEVKNQP